jgi:hypothetical protein
MLAGRIIATREFDLEGDPPGRASLVIARPHQDGDWRCDFEIRGLGLGDIDGCAMGVDPVQALFLALKNIASLLYTSEEFKSGRLTWFGQRNLGLPTADAITPLVPE